MAEMRKGDVIVSHNLSQQTSPAHATSSLNCSYCENMSKNLQYLENYLRNNTAKNSCNSCSTCLSFLLYMKQQCVPQPRLEQTRGAESCLSQPTIMPSAVSPDTYNMTEIPAQASRMAPVKKASTKTLPTAEPAKLNSPLKSRLKSSLSLTKSKLFKKSSPVAEPPPKKLTKMQSAGASKQRLSLATVKKPKKLLVAVKKSSSQIAPDTSLDTMTKTSSVLSKSSAGSKVRRLKVPSAKSSLSKELSQKRTKRKLKSRAPKKNVSDM